MRETKERDGWPWDNSGVTLIKGHPDRVYIIWTENNATRTFEVTK